MDDLNPLEVINRGNGQPLHPLCELHSVLSIDQACTHIPRQVTTVGYKRVSIDSAVSLFASLPLLLKFRVKQVESSSERSILR